ncbi:MAG: pantoate--beta-alanine ligase [Myxococcota bacterium]
MRPTEPLTIERVRDLWAWADGERARGRRIALVPTMGALHEGHLSLVRHARRICDAVVVSIFVNPTQFGTGEDLESYPRDLDGDRRKLAAVGCDVVFAPSALEIYPEGDCTRVEVGGPSRGLCGRSRPGHFRGVATVVTRLLAAAKPHVAVFGRKDYQQWIVIRRMARDLCLDVEIVGVPTVREPDGLAMSSRNAYLSPEARRQAPQLHAALLEARRLHQQGERSATRLAAAVRQRIQKAPLAELDYVEVVHAETLAPLSRLRAASGAELPALIAVAARFEEARLIDNIVVGPESDASGGAGPRPEGP